MKPTQEQVIAWAREVGIERCDCEPRCHLHFGGMGSLTTLATLAYEAGRKDENEACAKVCGDMLAMTKYEKIPQEVRFALYEAENAIRARREQ